MSAVPFDVKEYDFSQQLNQAREDFVGRRWLYDNIESVLRDPLREVPGVLIIGEPGTGKSALASQLVCSKSTSKFIYKRILGYHLCKYFQRTTRNAGRFIRSLADMIARRIPEYGYIISHAPLTQNMLTKDCLHDVYRCFEEAILAPLVKLNPQIQDDYYIIIDALDECYLEENDDSASYSITHLLNRFVHRFPKWMKLVITTRNHTDVTRTFMNFAIIHLSPKDPRNLADVETYIASSLEKDTSKMLTHNQDNEDSFNDHETVVSYLSVHSQGNFLVTKKVIDCWRSEPDPIHCVFPQTLKALYENDFQKVYSTATKFKSARDILEVIVSSFEPTTVETIFNVLHNEDKELIYEYDFLPKLKRLSQFLSYQENSTVTLFHLSLHEWLTKDDDLGRPYFVSIKQGHKRWIEYYFDLMDTRHANTASNISLLLAEHIAFGGWTEQYFHSFRSLSSTIINSSLMESNRTFLHQGASTKNQDVLRLFLVHFTAVDIQDKHGFTPAFLAVTHGYIVHLKLLIERGASIHYKMQPPPHPLKTRFIVDPIRESTSAFWSSNMLHAASQCGHLELVKFLVFKGISVDKTNGLNLTTIELAAERGYGTIVRFLIAKGATLHENTLHRAAASGHASIVKVILNAGVKHQCMKCDGSFYWLGEKHRYQAIVFNDFQKWEGTIPPGHYTTWKMIYHYQSMYLRRIKSYALFDDKNLVFCQSALHVAVAEGHLHVVKLILSRFPKSAYCRDYSGRTPLHKAIQANNIAIAEVLIQSAKETLAHLCKNVQTLKHYRRRHLDSFKKYEYLSAREELVYDSDVCPCGYSPLHLAARYSYIKIGKLLVINGVSLNVLDCDGATPMHVAACHGHYNFILWLTSYKQSATLESKSSNGSSILHSAAVCGNYKLVELLIRDGFNHTSVDHNGMTSLHYAVFKIKGTSSETSFTFAQCSRIPYHKEADNYFMHYSPKDGFIFHNLDEGKDPLRSEMYDQQCHTVKVLSRLGGPAVLNVVDKRGRSALHYAAENGLECVVRVLLTQGAKVTALDENGNRPLDLTMDRTKIIDNTNFKKGGCSNFLERFENLISLNYRKHAVVARYLMEKELKLLSNITYACSLVHRTIRKKHPFMLHMLLRQGADINCKDKEGSTPLTAYLQNGGRWIDVVLKRFNAPLTITCGKPFNTSQLHLFSFREPTVESDNFFTSYSCNKSACTEEPGPLIKAILLHPLKYQVLNNCKDAEGYTALHRAIQGGNVFAVKKFLSWGADPHLLAGNRYNALTLAVTYSGLKKTRNDKHSKMGMDPKLEIDTKSTSELILLLLKYLGKHKNLKMECNSKNRDLTVYHLAAYRGFYSVVEHLLDLNPPGLNIDCPNIDGVTPLYLAKLSQDTDSDPWSKVVMTIEDHGGKLQFPSRKAEYHIIYRHLYGSLLEPLTDEHPEVLHISDQIKRCSPEMRKTFESQKNEQDYFLNFYGNLLGLIIASTLNYQNNYNSYSNQFQELQREVLEFLDSIKDDNNEIKVCDEKIKIYSFKRKPARRKDRKNSISSLLKNVQNIRIVKQNQIRWTRQNIVCTIRDYLAKQKRVTEGWAMILKYRENLAIGDLRTIEQSYHVFEKLQFCSLNKLYTRNFALYFNALFVRNQALKVLDFGSYYSKFVESRKLNSLGNTGMLTLENPWWTEELDILQRYACGSDDEFKYLNTLTMGLDHKTRIFLERNEITSTDEDKPEIPSFEIKDGSMSEHAVLAQVLELHTKNVLKLRKTFVSVKKKTS